MTMRKLNRLAICFVCLVAAPAGVLLAEQPVSVGLRLKEPNTKAQLESSLFLFLRDGKLHQRVLSESAGPLLWRLATATYGNQLGVEICDLDIALRRQLGIEDGV